MKIVVVILVVMMVACGAGLYYCGKKVVDTAAEISDQVTEEGVDISNPLGALRALSGMAEDLQKMQEELEAMEPADPLPFQTLIDEGLPETPSGWTARKPRGSLTTMGNFQITQASCRYENQADGKTIDVSISDRAFNRAVYAPFFLAANFSQETTEGYNKGIKLGDDPGREEFQYERKRGERTVLYSKRYSIVVKGTGIQPEDLSEWYGLVRKQNLPR